MFASRGDVGSLVVNVLGAAGCLNMGLESGGRCSNKFVNCTSDGDDA